MAVYLYRRGDGNEGDYPRSLVALKDTDSPWAALTALVANDYHTRSRTRRHILRCIETDGEGGEYGVHAVVYEGPDGERAFESAWLTAALEYVAPADLGHMIERHGGPSPLREELDAAALATYRKAARR